MELYVGAVLERITAELRIKLLPYIRTRKRVNMKELDVVKLIRDFAGISAGTNGTIVLEYDGTHFEVEFVDEAGDTIDVVTTPSEFLALVESA